MYYDTRNKDIWRAVARRYRDSIWPSYPRAMISRSPGNGIRRNAAVCRVRRGRNGEGKDREESEETRKGADNEDEDDDALSRISPAPTATGDESVKNERERAEWIHSRTRSTAKRQIYVFDTLRYIGGAKGAC